MTALRFLWLEGNRVAAEPIEAMLQESALDCELLRVESASSFVATLETDRFDLILADYSLPELDGLAALEIARHRCPDVPFIFVADRLGEEVAIEALKSGATDYVLKQQLRRLVPCIQRALREAQEYPAQRQGYQYQHHQQDQHHQQAEAARDAQQMAIGSQSEVLLRAVATNLPNSAVFIVDRELRYLLAEGKALENVGMTSESLVGKTLWEALDPALATEYEPHYRQSLQGEPFRLEHYSHNRYYISHGTPLFNDRGKIDAVLVVSYDITDRKTVERERERFLAVGSDLLVITGNNGYFRWVSPTFERVLGWTTEEMTSRPWMEFVHPDDVLTSLAETNNLFAGHETLAFENRYRHKEGSYRWLLWKAQFDPEEQVLYGTAVDITQLKQSGEALRQSEECFRAIVNQVTAGIAQTDLTGQFTLVNQRYCDIVGYSREELLQMRMQDITHPDDLPRNTELFRQLVTEGREFAIQKRYVRKDGAEAWVNNSVSIIRDASGNPESAVAVVLDISEQQAAVRDRQHTEEQLRESRTFLTHITDVAPIILYVYDLDETCTVWSNNNLALVLGYTPDEVQAMGQNVLSLLLHSEDAKRYPSHFQRLRHLQPGELAEFEYRMQHKDGSWHWLSSWEKAYLRHADGTVRQIVGAAHDITDRKRAAAALQQRESELRLVTNTVPALIAFVDANQRYRYNNRAYEEWFEHSAAEIHGKHLKDVLGEAAYEAIRPYVEQVLTGQQVTFESQVPYKDGGTRYVNATYVPQFNRQGDVEGFVALVSDINNRKQVEEALRRSETHLRLIIESARDYAIFTLDLNGIIASWNSGAERLLGYAEAEAIGCHGRMIFTPEDIEQGRAEYEMQIVLSQGRVENERWHVRKDGSRFWASGLMMPLLHESGEPQGFVKILQDKTIQKQAGDRLQLLYETTSDLLATDQPLAMMHNLFNRLAVQFDLHYYYNFAVEEKDNQPMLHLRNYKGISEATAQEIEWVQFGEYLCGLVAQERRQLVFDQSQLLHHPNAQNLCAMGATAYAGQPLLVQGKLIGTLSFASRTRTHFTPAEIDLLQSTCDQVAIALERANLTVSLQQQAEQLRQANRIKDEFLAVLSHELRSPLNPILGWSKLLQTGKLNAAQTKQALATIERNAKLQSELIEDLLDVSRILRGKLSLNVSSIHLASIIQAAIETVQLAAEAKSITIETNLDTKIGQVAGDSTRLQQVVWNLLSNAVKFTPSGGQIEVRLEKVIADSALVKRQDSDQQPITNSQSPISAYAQITVRDNGKGITPDFLPHVFDYFRQEDGATTRKFGGLGLGLAIVRHLIELHGGTVHVESAGEDLGATFTVNLPLSNAENKQQAEYGSVPAATDSPLPLQNVRVLVIDDDVDSREFVVFVLEQAGASVTVAATASEGFLALSQSCPDVLLSDIGMPDMDGYMLMRQIRALSPEQGGKIPAIALTAYAGDFNQQQALAAGFQQHLSKPVEPETLIRAIGLLAK